MPTAAKQPTKRRDRRDRTPVASRMQLLDIADVCSLMRISRSTFDRQYRDDPDFPSPARMTNPTGRNESGLRYMLGEIEDYLAAKFAAAKEGR